MTYGGAGAVGGIFDSGVTYHSAAHSLSPSPILLTLSVFLILVCLVSALPPPRHYAAPGGRCGPEHNAACDNICCSGAGYCGTTEEFCSVPNNCQEAWGWCDSKIMPQGADVTHDIRKFNADIPAKVDKCTVPNTLALTFDDGPSNFTEAVLDILKEHNARATFFVAGVNNGHGQLDIRYADTLRRMVSEGHQIGSHTWSHPNLDKLSSYDRKMELWKNERAITNCVGKMPTFMRPPMVICGDACMKDMKALGYHVVGWEVDSQDWHDPQPSVTETTSRLTKEMHQRHNMFLIQHDTSYTTIDVLKSVLENKPAAWKAVPLVECLGHSLDDAYRLPLFAAADGGRLTHIQVHGRPLQTYGGTS